MQGGHHLVCFCAVYLLLPQRAFPTGVPLGRFVQGGSGPHFQACHILQSGPLVSTLVKGLCGCLQPGTRRQRCGKKHGHQLLVHDRHALCGHSRRVATGLCDRLLLLGDWLGHRVGCLAHLQDPRSKNHHAQTCRPVQCWYGGNMTLFRCTALGIDVSSAHIITGSMVGVAANTVCAWG